MSVSCLFGAENTEHSAAFCPPAAAKFETKHKVFDPMFDLFGKSAHAAFTQGD